MQLTDAHRTEFREKGYVLVPDVIGLDELAVLDNATLSVIESDGPQVAKEPTGEPHVVYGMHQMDDRLTALSRHPSIVGPAMDLLNKPIYVHQSRVNVKQTGGSIVKWHQDFGTYHRVDGVPRPEGLMIAVFLDDITPCNAPVLAIPGSHAHGIVSEAEKDPSSRDFGQVSKYRFDIPMSRIDSLIQQHGIEPIMGTKGSVLFMDMTVVHGSTVNITPLRRIILYLNVCTTDNRGESYERPDYYAARDFSAIEPDAPGALLGMA
jgi:ectoine hydroxylase